MQVDLFSLLGWEICDLKIIKLQFFGALEPIRLIFGYIVMLNDKNQVSLSISFINNLIN